MLLTVNELLRLAGSGIARRARTGIVPLTPK
jgi:hypothetical protein